MNLCVPKLSETPQNFAASMLKLVCEAHQATNTMKVFSGRYDVNQTAPIQARRGFAVELNRGFLGRLPTFARSGHCGDSAGDFPGIFIKTKNAFKKNPLKIRWKIREMSEPHGRTKSADAQETRIRRRHHPKENPRFLCTRCARAPSLAAASPLLLHSTEIILAAAVRSCFSLGHGSCIVAATSNCFSQRPR